LIESRAYDQESGTPTVVLVISGTHDISRLLYTLSGGSANSQLIALGHALAKKVRRHSAGRSALQLLAKHGGPDFTEPGPDQLDQKFLIDLSNWLHARADLDCGDAPAADDEVCPTCWSLAEDMAVVYNQATGDALLVNEPVSA
jgi:hypothetical protein